MKDLYFVVLNEMMSGPIPSQVVAPARVQASRHPHHRVHILFLEPARVALSRRARSKLKELRSLWPQGQILLCPYIGRLGPRAPAVVISAVIRLLGRPKSLVLHCRGPESTLQAEGLARRRGGRLVFDARGDGEAETALRLVGQGHAEDSPLVRRAVSYARERDRLAAGRADAIIAVGESLALKLSSLAGGPAKPVEVVPCCIERPTFSPSLRTSTRRELNAGDDDLLLVNVATNATWEAFDLILRFFRLVQEQRRSRLLFVTTLDPDLVTKGVAPTDPIRASLDFRSIEPAAVPAYLSAADIGLLLRRPHPVFQAGIPVKFAEYLAAGLPVAVSAGIGDSGALVEEYRIGSVVQDSRDVTSLARSVSHLLDLINAGPDQVRQRAIETCEKRFLWQNYLPSLERAYGFR